MWGQHSDSLLSHISSDRKLREASQFAIHGEKPVILGLLWPPLNTTARKAVLCRPVPTRLSATGTKAKTKTRVVNTHRYGALLKANARRLERTRRGEKRR